MDCRSASAISPPKTRARSNAPSVTTVSSPMTPPPGTLRLPTPCRAAKRRWFDCSSISARIPKCGRRKVILSLRSRPKPTIERLLRFFQIQQTKAEPPGVEPELPDLTVAPRAASKPVVWKDRARQLECVSGETAGASTRRFVRCRQKPCLPQEMKDGWNGYGAHSGEILAPDRRGPRHYGFVCSEGTLPSPCVCGSFCVPSRARSRAAGADSFAARPGRDDRHPGIRSAAGGRRMADVHATGGHR